MPQVTCSRCFAVFEAEGARPGTAPLCPSCAQRAPRAPHAPAAGVASPRPRARRGRPRPVAGRLALLAGAVVVLAGATVLVVRARAPAAEAPPPPTFVEQRVEAWRAAGLVPGAAPDPARAEALVDAGFAALAADLPSRAAGALAAFREAIALAPARADRAVAGYAAAYAESVTEEADPVELLGAHDLVREALERAPDDPALLGGCARLLLAVPSASNAAEAHALATTAVRLAPADGTARLALGLATLRSDPAAAARLLEEGIAAVPGDRRLRSAAARARWAAGDAAGALAHASERLALDPAHPGALALRAEIELAADRVAAARATVAAWEAAEPGSPLPPLVLARVAYQREDDPALARRLLELALSRNPPPFTAARVLAHRAAVELASGDVAAAQAAVDDALARVPASAPARFQAALLAFRRRDARALRESAGVLGDRGGPLAAALLAARSAELSGTEDEAQEATLALAALAPADPAVLLGAAGALARLRASGPALEVARRALARDPLEARLRRAPTDFWEGQEPLAEAARRLEAIARGEPAGAAVAFAAAAACELLLGRTVAAERLAREAADASPQWAVPAALLAQISLDRGQTRGALALALDALRATPDGAVARAVYGRALEALGRNHDAEVAYRRAAEVGPELATPRLALARLLVRRGETRGVRALLDEVVAGAPDLAEARGALLALTEGAARRGP